MKRFLLYFFAISVCTLVLPRLPRAFSEEEPEDMIHVLQSADGTVYELSVEDYVLGVMQSAGFDYGDETMKAIAVALRSSVKYCETFHPVHQNAAVCDDPDCCAAFCTDVFSEKAIRAVAETAGKILLYEGSPAACPTCEDAGTRTESCEALYGVPLPYLVSVAELYPGAPEVITAAGSSVLALFGDPGAQGEPTFACDRSGRVREIWLGEQTIDGQAFASAIGLPSLLFTAESDGETFTFTCYGVGDGVGLSRKGAAAMEDNGFSWREILAFYFRGTEIASFL